MRVVKAIHLARRRSVIERAVRMKKILILGGSGMLGYAVKHVFEVSKMYDVHWTERVDPTRNPNWNQHYLHAAAPDVAWELESLFISLKPEYVLNCIGVIKPRMADNIEQAVATNALFPHILARVCEDTGCKLIHITTDCVFSGRQGPYTETSIHDALDDYGKSKSLGEAITKAMVLRTSIIGPEIRNKHSLISWVQKQQDQVVQGYTNHLWNGVTTFELARVFRQIIDQNLWKVGIYHIHSPEAVNKYELVDLILQRYNITPSMFKHTESLVGCDRRLETIYPEFLMSLVIPSISYQIRSLPE